MITTHLNLTTKEVVARWHGDWPLTWLLMTRCINKFCTWLMGLSMGIINQFPKKFE